MSLNRKPLRYAHPEGHTDVCYFTGTKGGLLTCGTDGDVRFWLNLMDDDPAASCVAEQALSIASKNEKIYVSTDNNTVQILTFPDLEKEGIITRFAATVCPLATTKNSRLIVSGACDMRIQVSNVDTSDSIELIGHQGPILGLSLDPREEYVASSSTDGTIRVWNVKDKAIVHIWNHVPKTNSFFSAKSYCTPSFHCVDGTYLAFPRNKEVVVVERGTWKELFKLQCSELKSELSICKFSECGTLIAASSLYGEVVVWNVKTKDLIGYDTHDRDTRITSFAWSLEKPTEIAFCDYLGMLGCIDVQAHELETVSSRTGDADIADGEDLDDLIENYNDENDDDGISLNKIKAGTILESENGDESEATEIVPTAPVAEIHLQQPFQPGSSPEHLFSRYMAWNDTGIVKCYKSEDGEESSIDIEFHDTSIHHALHMSNYLQHTMAALSSRALALACPPNDDTPSKLVVISLQGWGSGNKEWSVEFDVDETAVCVAAGDNFVAAATSRRNLRLFTACGTQREVIAVPGPLITMNALGHHLVVVYHSGLGTRDDQHMKMMWIRIRGVTLRSETLSVPLAPESTLTWTGLTDLGSPTIMDSDGVIRVYEKRSSLWKVASHTDNLRKGKSDHYFLIGISETEQIARCVLCKGSYYPPTLPRPVTIEIPLVVPLCNLESEKTLKETKLWQVGVDTNAEKEVLLALFALACRGNAEYRAVELCEQLVSERVLELAIRYAGRLGRMALVNKLQSIAETKEEQIQCIENELEAEENRQNEVEEPAESLLSQPIEKPQVQIKPLTLSMRKSNPFRVTEKSPAPKGLSALNRLEEPPQKPVTPIPPPSKAKAKPKKVPRESFVSWYGRNKQRLKDEFPSMSDKEITTKALALFKEEEKASAENSRPAAKESFVSWYAKNKQRLTEEFPSLSDKEITTKALALFKEEEKASAENGRPAVKESFVSWYAKNKQRLTEEFPSLSDKEITTKALSIYKNEARSSVEENISSTEESQESRKRKLSDVEEPSPKSSARKLAAFAADI